MKEQKRGNKKNFLKSVTQSQQAMGYSTDFQDGNSLGLPTSSQQSCGVLNSVGNKKGQVTIFIIIAIIIVALAVLVYLFYPKIKTTLGLAQKNPSEFLKECIGDSLDKSVQKISSRGGSVNPENYILYKNETIEYLCYTTEYYQTCVMQQPMLKKHIESGIAESVKIELGDCLDELKENFKKQGYEVDLKTNEMDVEMIPKKIILKSGALLTLTKGDESETYKTLDIVLNNNLYEFVSLANSILNWETKYGDAETTTYMNYYRDLKVEKLLQSDGSTIYILTDRNTKNKFQFASRSVAWPAGYGEI